MKIGNKLKTLRVSKNIEPIILSEKLDISISTYRRIERNESVPDLNLLEKIANVFEIELKELINDETLNVKNNKKNELNLDHSLVNYLYEKLINQFEQRLEEKEQIIIDLKKKLSK